MKIKIIISTIFITFIQSVNANIIDDVKNKLINNNIFTLQECVEKLTKQDLTEYKSQNLCIDKYANKLDRKNYTEEDSNANKEGRVTISLTNDSSSFVIKKIIISGVAYCQSLNPDTNKMMHDEDICEKQYFNHDLYTDIKPKSSKKSKIYNQFTIPEDVKHGTWSWYINTLDIYGFTLDY